MYTGKEKEEVHEDPEIQNLAKSAQAVAKLCKHLQPNRNHKVYVDNWFTTKDMLLYLKRRGFLACGTIRSNRLQDCLLASNKEMKKERRGSFDFKADLKSGVIIAKWFNNSSVYLASNFVGVEPITTIPR